MWARGVAFWLKWDILWVIIWTNNIDFKKLINTKVWDMNTGQRVKADQYADIICVQLVYM